MISDDKKHLTFFIMTLENDTRNTQKFVRLQNQNYLFHRQWHGTLLHSTVDLYEMKEKKSNENHFAVKKMVPNEFYFRNAPLARIFCTFAL